MKKFWHRNGIQSQHDAPTTTGISRRQLVIGSAFAMFGASFIGVSPAFADAGFMRWIEQFRSTARQSGISDKTFNLAFRGVTTPDPEVLKKAAWQPEFKDPTWNYFDNRVQDEAVAQGQAHGRQWAKVLNIIEQRFGVSRYILLAIWSMESNYGAALKRDDIMRDAIRSLATLAYGYPKRAKFGRTQLIAAMQILQSGDIDRSHLTGSWAGALGHTQFIPTSYLDYAVDIDGDGRRDIWNSIPDALGTAANLLHKNGWQSGKTWGYEVILPATGKFPGGSLRLAEWQRLGLRRANGSAFPFPNDSATLKLPDGREGPVFLVTKNFNVIKRYNSADRYAFAVGLLADRIAGYGGLVRDWSRPFTPISMSERQELQNHLKSLGYYNGPIDGRIGEASKTAIQAFQKRNGLKADGHPSREVLSVLRRR